MRFQTLSLFYTCAIASTSAIRLPLQQARRSTQSSGSAVAVTRLATGAPKVLASSDVAPLSLGDFQDLIYSATVTVAGNSYTVQLDSGSSDLWVQGPTAGSLTTYSQRLNYSAGYASGTIAFAPVEFAGISIPTQAYIDVSSVSNAVITDGLNGILGLGFTSLSYIDYAINKTGGSNGRCIMYNLFQVDKTTPNFMSFSLDRTSQPGDTVQGSFTIGEYEPDYAQIADNAPISTWPVKYPNRWTVLLDAFMVGNQTITPNTSVVGAPSNRAVINLDTGTSYTVAPLDVVNAIYSDIPNATFSSSLNRWLVPCEAEVDLALQIGGEIFPVHPLDTVPYSSAADNTTCIGSFMAWSGATDPEYDWLVGDNFLRSVYTVYDFGDFDSSGNLGAPYIKLLSLVDPSKASVEFHNERGGTPTGNITFNGSGSSADAPATGAVTLSGDLVDSITKIGQIFPIMLGVMALNGLLLIILVIVGIVLCRRWQGKNTARYPRSRQSPGPSGPASRMNSIRNSARASYLSALAPPGGPHVYQPVSMAMTEDTMFTPSSPSHHNKERPKSSSNSFRSASITREDEKDGSQDHLKRLSEGNEEEEEQEEEQDLGTEKFTNPTTVTVSLTSEPEHIPEDEPFVRPRPTFHSSAIDRPHSYHPTPQTEEPAPAAYRPSSFYPGVIPLSDAPIGPQPSTPIRRSSALRSSPRPIDVQTPPAQRASIIDSVTSPTFYQIPESTDPQPRSLGPIVGGRARSGSVSPSFAVTPPNLQTPIVPIGRARSITSNATNASSPSALQPPSPNVSTPPSPTVPHSAGPSTRSFLRPLFAGQGMIDRPHSYHPPGAPIGDAQRPRSFYPNAVALSDAPVRNSFNRTASTDSASSAETQSSEAQKPKSSFPNAVTLSDAPTRGPLIHRAGTGDSASAAPRPPLSPLRTSSSSSISGEGTTSISPPKAFGGPALRTSSPLRGDFSNPAVDAFSDSAPPRSSGGSALRTASPLRGEFTPSGDSAFLSTSNSPPKTSGLSPLRAEFPTPNNPFATPVTTPRSPFRPPMRTPPDHPPPFRNSTFTPPNAAYMGSSGGGDGDRPQSFAM